MLPVAVLPAASARVGLGVNTRAPIPAVMLAAHVPVHAPATVAVMVAPTPLIVLEANEALVLFAAM